MNKNNITKDIKIISNNQIDKLKNEIIDNKENSSSQNNNIRLDSSKQFLKIEAYKLKNIGNSLKDIYDFLLIGNSKLDGIYLDKFNRYTLKDLHKIIKGDMPFY